VTIQLLLGDATKLLQDIIKSIDKFILVSDPPFNIGYHYDLHHDRMPHDDYHRMLATVFGEHRHVLIHYAESLHEHSRFIGKSPQRVVTWCYNSNTPRQHRDIAFYGIKPDFRKVSQPYKNLKDKRIIERMAAGKTARLYDWWEVNQVKNVSADKTDHPCQMPQEVMRRVIGVLPDDYTVIDPFMGSGTTGSACAEWNRDFIGIELDPKYFEIAQRRLTQNRTSL
jgi:DNA modification methylase